MTPDEREAALRKLLDAIETMDQKITPYGEREDGTILHYIVADSTWHRILAAARNPSWFSSEPEMPATPDTDPTDDPISDSRQPEDGPPPGRWPR
jgi:hypothetical protein